jgi:hypothetical protein
LSAGCSVIFIVNQHIFFVSMISIAMS